MQLNDLAERYVAVWNEPDPEARRKAVADLWTEDALMRLAPPQEMRTHATKLGVTPFLEARGHDELELRVVRSYEEFVAPGQNVFAVRQGARRLGDVVIFEWAMAAKVTAEQLGAGLEVVIVGRDGRIKEDLQFIDP
ncbi:hypothetical protein ACFQ07_28145 [Actinomadura adrarensis]|uniref:Nuclear transport factor 2 family protein n=1 Tax=Actinomadura adrarensis TaxID=1819600 RepID=A0ABW3CR97_9ACTN